MVPFSNNHFGHGVRDVQCPTNAPVTTNSIVLASATEVFGDGHGNWIPFQGAASIQVLNCVPRPEEIPGVVYVRVNIMWDSDLLIRISGVVI
jgi:hypothetical protein